VPAPGPGPPKSRRDGGAGARGSIAARMAKTAPSRISAQRLLGQLRLAAKKGDRATLSLALDQMRTLAYSPRYWERYLSLLGNPLARLVDLLVIKQGERIAHQKGWKLSRATAPRAAAKTRKGKKTGARRRPTPSAGTIQPSLFE